MKYSTLVKIGCSILLLIAVGHFTDIMAIYYFADPSNTTEAMPASFYFYSINVLGIIFPLVACYLLWFDFPFAKHVVATILTLDVARSLYSAGIVYYSTNGEWGFNLIIRYSVFAVIFLLYLYFLYKTKDVRAISSTHTA